MAIQVNPQTGFIYDTDGYWYPPINEKQLEIFNDHHRFTLITGPRKSGKTFGIIHKVLRHAFDVNGAMIAIVCKTMKNAKSAGVWVLLSKALKEWENNCYGFKVVEGPKTTGDTKLSYVKIRNRHGSISEIQCHSLEHAQEVEAKFKSSNYSMFWLNEGDQFCTEYAFNILSDSLRMTPQVPFNEHQILLDCNPPDTGPNNWLHDLFFKFKDNKPEPGETERAKKARDRVHRIVVMIADNPQLDPEERDDLIERYRKRPGLYARFIEGKWEQDIVGGHFSDVWDNQSNIIGNVDCPEDEKEIAVPTPACSELLGGWDMGESKNHSFHIIEKIAKEHPTTGKKIVSFSVIDEYVVIRNYMSIQEFVESCLEKIDHWNKYQQLNHKVTPVWRHWSDTSAFNDRAAADKSDAAIAYEASDGRIILNAAPKYAGSNHDKVKLLWQLLYQKRLFVSAQLSATRAMFTNLRSDPHTASHYVKRDDHKHPFDSLAYPIIAEAPFDMMRSSEIGTAKKDKALGLVIV